MAQELGKVVALFKRDLLSRFRFVLRRHENGFSETVLRKVVLPGKKKFKWETVTHKEFVFDEHGR